MSFQWMDEGTVSSCQSYVDPTDVDYEPPKSPVSSEPSVTVDKLPMFKCTSKLTNTVPQLARSSVGFHTASRILTSFCMDLWEDGYIDQPLAFPKSKFESLAKRDGDRRIAALSNLKLQGSLTY